MATIRPTIKTAPGVTPFKEVDLLDKATFEWMSPSVRDLEQDNYRGVRTVVKRSIQKRAVARCRGLTATDKLQIDDWKSKRIKVRPFANYGKDTYIYQSFQRANAAGQIGFQIGEEPTFASALLSGTGIESFVNEDGLLETVVNGTPRYEASGYGGKGLWIEPQRKNFLINSLPETGTEIWTTRTGTPSIGIASDFPPKVSGKSEVLSVVGQSGDGIRFQLSSTPSSGNVSFSIWIAGQGDVDIVVYNQITTSIIGSLIDQSLTTEYQRYDIPNLTKSSLDALEFRIDVKATGAIFYPGPMQLDNGKLVTSWIDTNAGGAGEIEQTQLVWPNLNPSDLDMTLFIAFVQPKTSAPASTPKQYLWHSYNSGNRWMLELDPVTNTYTFQKKSGTPVSYVTTKNEGDPILIACQYRFGEFRIFEDGVLRDTAVNSAIHGTGATGIHIGDYENDKQCVPTPVHFARADRVYHDSATVTAISEQYVDAEARAFMLGFEGRDFMIDDHSLTPLEGNPDQYDGHILFQEVDVHEQATTEER